MKKINVENYKKTETSIHKAVQILAYLGKKLGTHRDDDSHTTVVWNAEKQALVGKSFILHGKEYTAELHFDKYELQINSPQRSNPFSIEEKTVPAVVDQIKKQLEFEKLPHFELHYELPEDYDLENYKIEKPSDKALKEWGEVRQFGNEIFEIVNEIIQPKSDVNIWPHHFDTGTYHVLEEDRDGEKAIVGTGLAVADTIVNEPYFYIYGWKKEGAINYEAIPDLSIGEWKIGDWKGAVVPLSKVLELEDAKAAFTKFFKTTFEFYTSQLK